MKTSDTLKEATKKLMNDPGMLFMGSMDDFMDVIAPAKEDTLDEDAKQAE